MGLLREYIKGVEYSYLWCKRHFYNDLDSIVKYDRKAPSKHLQLSTLGEMHIQSPQGSSIPRKSAISLGTSDLSPNEECGEFKGMDRKLEHLNDKFMIIYLREIVCFSSFAEEAFTASIVDMCFS